MTLDLQLEGACFESWQGFLLICREKVQLDATQWFIELIICSTCDRHYYAHHQELETIQVITAYGT